MKKSLITIMIFALALCGYSATQNVYVDVSEKRAQNELAVTDGSTNTVVFNVADDGAALSLSGYTPVLFVSTDYTFRPDETVTATGTSSGSAATFSIADIKPTLAKNGYVYQLAMRSGTSPTYTYSYQVNGKLRVDDYSLAVSGSPAAVSAFGGLNDIQVATSVTNGQVLTPTAATHILNGIGGANDTTNTITLANAVSGQNLRLIVNGSSTNLITIADSGNALLSGAWLGDNNDVINLVGVGTNWVQTAPESDN